MRVAARLTPVFAVATLATHVFGQGITGTDHDLRSRFGLTEICQPCHIPHNGVTASDGLLWNHEATPGTGYTHYTTLDGDEGNIDGPSKMCLSCHDGLVAIDSYGGNPGGTYMTGSPKLGPNMSDDHPIGLVYPAGEPGYEADAATVEATLPLYDVGASVNRVECGSCHDPHNGPGVYKFLRMSNANSALCIVCHKK